MRGLTLQMKPRMSVEQALQSTLAHLRSPCKIPLKCMYSTPYATSSKHFSTHRRPLQRHVAQLGSHQCHMKVLRHHPISSQMCSRSAMSSTLCK